MGLFARRPARYQFEKLTLIEKVVIENDYRSWSFDVPLCNMTQQQEVAQQQQEVEQQEEQQKVASHFLERAVLKGHNLAITALEVDSEHTKLVSASRDNTALVWKLPKTQENWGVEDTRLVGHNHFVSGIALSSDATHLITSSWDKTLRLWELQTRTCKKIFNGHAKDALAVVFSPCNRRIISTGRDNTVRIWNILGECKESMKFNAWGTSISCAPMPAEDSPLIFAVGFWDGKVRVFKVQDKCEKLFELDAHKGRVLSVSFTPDGQWLMTGGSDHKVCMWAVASGQKILSFTAPQVVNALSACPTRAWICAATYEGIAVWDIQNKTQIDLVQPNFPELGTKRHEGRTPDCTSICWSEDGTVLYAGYNNGEIRVWEVRSE